MSNLENFSRLSLDPSLYSLKGDELESFKQLTGIGDDEELKEHILAVQREAFAVGRHDVSLAGGC